MTPRRRLRDARHRLALAAALCGCGGKVIRSSDAGLPFVDTPVVDTPDAVVVDVNTTTCPRGLMRCGSGCVDPVIDPFHCGSCTRTCASTEQCIDGTCVAPCNAPSARCDGRCVDVTVDPNHCGACGRACVGGTCRGGRCRLPTDPGYVATLDMRASESWIDACAAPGHASLLVRIDDSSSGTTLPFGFTYWGTTLPAGSPVNVCSNGWIGLDGRSDSALSGSIPQVGTPDAVVAAHWVDLVTDSAGVCVATTGTAPSRRFVVEWAGVRYFSNTVGAPMTFEIVLEETTGAIELLYPTLAARQATVGVENFDGSDGVSLCTPPGALCPLTSGARVRFTPRP